MNEPTNQQPLNPYAVGRPFVTLTTTTTAAHTPPAQRLQDALLGLADGLHSLGFADSAIVDIITSLVYDWAAEHLPTPPVEPEEDMGS